MNCVYEHKNNLYVSNTLYNKDQTLELLFKKRRKSYKPVYSSSSSSTSSSSSSFEDEEYLNNDKTINNILADSVGDTGEDEYCYEYKNMIIGGNKDTELLLKKKSKTKITKTKPFSKIKYLKIMPTFINVLKGRILYNNKSKFTIEPLVPSDNKNVILGILIDLYKIDETVGNVTLDKINKYIKNYDVVPLLYNDGRNVVYKNKKTYFFSKNSKLAFITFKMPSTCKYYVENIDLAPLSKLHDIDENKLSVNSIVAHFIYDNYYFLHTRPENLKIDKCYLVDIDSMEFKEIEKIRTIMPNDRKLSIDEIYSILKKGKQFLKF